MTAAHEMTGMIGRRRHFRNGEAAWLCAFTAPCVLPFQWRVTIQSFDVVVPGPVSQADARALMDLHAARPAGSG